MRVRPDRADRLAGGAGEPRQRDKKDELLPDRDTAVTGRLRLDVGARERLLDLGDARTDLRQLPEDFAEHDTAVRTGLLDHAGPPECGRDIGGPAKHRLFTHHGSDFGGAVDAVLNREDRCGGTEQRRDHRQGRGVVISLDGHDHDVDRPDLRRVLFRACVNGEVAEVPALDLKPVLTDGREMSAARDERDVVSRPRELRAVVAADRAGAEDRKTHDQF